MDDFEKLCAPRSTEEWRIEAHRWFDRLWRYAPDPSAARTKWYLRLAEFMQLPAERAHISNFGADECQTVINFSKKFVRGGKKHGRKVYSPV